MSELQREQQEEQEQPPQWELEVLPEELEVLPEVVPALSPQEIQWGKVSERTHSSHTRFLETSTHWVCTRCGAQAAKEGRLRLALLAVPCKAPSTAAKLKLKKLQGVGIALARVLSVRARAHSTSLSACQADAPTALAGE